MPPSVLFPDRGPLLVRVGDAGGSDFLGLGASRGRPDHPMLLSPEPHATYKSISVVASRGPWGPQTWPISVSDAMIRAA